MSYFSYAAFKTGDDFTGDNSADGRRGRKLARLSENDGFGGGRVTLRAAYNVPGFNPPNANAFGTFGLASSEGGVSGPASAQFRSLMGEIPTRNTVDSGLPPTSNHTTGTSKSMEQITIPMLTRPFVLPNDAGVTRPKFREGDLVFIYKGNKEMQQAAFQDSQHTYTLATLPQVRAFEAAHVLYERKYPDAMGIRKKADGGYEIINKDTSEAAAPAVVRAGFWTRWDVAGVVQTVDDSNFPVVALTVCVGGPTMMRNYFGPSIYVGADLFLSEDTTIPEAIDEATRNALTVKSVAAWPNDAALAAYEGMIAQTRERLEETSADYQMVRTETLAYVRDTRVPQVPRVPGRYVGNDSTFRILGKVMQLYLDEDVYDTAFTLESGFEEHSGFHGYGDSSRTQVYSGDVRILLPNIMGMRPVDVQRQRLSYASKG